MDCELKAPPSKVRVIRVQVGIYRHSLVGDYDDITEAFQLVDKNNENRGPNDDMWYVYDDQGHCLRGDGNIWEGNSLH